MATAPPPAAEPTLPSYGFLGSTWAFTAVPLGRTIIKISRSLAANVEFLEPPVALGFAMYFIGGWHHLLWGYFLATTLLWHGTFTINSLSHMFGSRRYGTTDDSKNNPILALVTMGEGWHNNHHYYPRSVRQGFFWWEYDFTYYILKGLEAVGVVWDLHVPSAKVIAGEHAIKGVRKPAAAHALGEAPARPAPEGDLQGMAARALATLDPARPVVQDAE